MKRTRGAWKHTRKFQTGAGLHIPWPCFVLSLCPSSERSPGTAPAPRLRAPSPLSTTLIHLRLWLSSSEIPLPFFFFILHLRRFLCDPSWHYKEINPPSTACAHFPAESGNGTRQTNLEMKLVQKAIRGFIFSFVLVGWRTAWTEAAYFWPSSAIQHCKALS